MEALRKRIGRNREAWEGFKFKKYRALDEAEADKVRSALYARTVVATRTAGQTDADEIKTAADSVGADADGKKDVYGGADTDKTAPDADEKTSGDIVPETSPDTQKETEACKDLPGAKEPPAALKNWFLFAASIVRLASIKKPMIWAVMLAPAVASFQNVLRVTSDITNEQTPALLLTIAFVCAPFVFVGVGIKSNAIKALTVALIMLESFCNTVRIYGGLTGFGHRGNPTRFLGIVCELFNSGTYVTATVLAGIFSLLAAAVMYAAYSQVRK
jgi:hypothetical protein